MAMDEKASRVIIPKKRDAQRDQEEETSMGDSNKRLKAPLTAPGADQEASSPYKSISALVNP